MSMRTKELLLTSILTVVSPSHGQIHSWANQDLYTTLQQDISLPHKIYTITDQGMIPLDTLSPGAAVIQRNVVDLKDTPLYMSGTRKHIGEYLWYDQYDYILKNYNNDTLSDSLKTPQQLNVNNFTTITFPLIYDELDKTVPHSLSALLQDPRFDAYRDSLHAQDTVIIQFKQPNGQHALCYYETGILRLATYETIGAGENTPRGLFRVDYSVKNKRSRKYRNAPMPYSLHIINNIFIHQGKVKSTEKSHGCNRIPWLYAEALYHLVHVPTLTMLCNEKQWLLDETQLQTLEQLKRKSPKVLIVD